MTNKTFTYSVVSLAVASALGTAAFVHHQAGQIEKAADAIQTKNAKKAATKTSAVEVKELASFDAPVDLGTIEVVAAEMAKEALAAEHAQVILAQAAPGAVTKVAAEPKPLPTFTTPVIVGGTAPSISGGDQPVDDSYNGFVGVEIANGKATFSANISSPVIHSGEFAHQWKAGVGVQETKETVASINYAVASHNMRGSAAVSVTDVGQATLRLDASHDLVEDADGVLAVGLSARAGVEGFDVGPSLELGTQSFTIKATPFDVMIGDRIPVEGVDPSKWNRVHYSLNPVMIAIGVIIGQRTSLDVLGIPAQELSPLYRLLGLFMDDEGEVMPEAKKEEVYSEIEAG